MSKIQTRQDLSIYNEANAFAITSRRACGKHDASDPSDPAFQKALRTGAFWLVELFQDDPFHCRVILDAELTPEEAAEVCGLASWTLQVPDGKLVIAGGREILEEGIDEDEEPDPDDLDQPYVVVPVPKGTYRLDLYTCFAGVNGPLGPWSQLGIDSGTLVAVGEGDTVGPNPHEPVGAWFRRTNPGVEMPYWLRMHCRSSLDCDPNHESEYRDGSIDWDALERDATGTIDFILRLTPVDAASPSAKPAPSLKPYQEEGFVPVCYPPILQARCPLGLKSAR